MTGLNDVNNLSCRDVFSLPQHNNDTYIVSQRYIFLLKAIQFKVEITSAANRRRSKEETNQETTIAERNEKANEAPITEEINEEKNKERTIGETNEEADVKERNEEASGAIILHRTSSILKKCCCICCCCKQKQEPGVEAEVPLAAIELNIELQIKGIPDGKLIANCSVQLYIQQS